MHIHLDPIGGIAGDMFAAAILDCFPNLLEHVNSIPAALNLQETVGLECTPHNDGVLSGQKFTVIDNTLTEHTHNSFSKICSDIKGSKISSGAIERAIDIFSLLATAEANVHGVDIDDVIFHEVGAIDSIVDIVTAAVLIDALGKCTWSIATAPIGSGRVMTQHGILPVPAPATLHLMRGMSVFHDSIEGERITPTGAAIVKHLDPSNSSEISNMSIINAGSGFGTKTFESIPNILRAIAFEKNEHSTTDRITIFSFEVDDQTPEDLAIGLDKIRLVDGVLDACVSPVMAKKGRQAQQIQILGSEGNDEVILAACFEQTTTLGVRFLPCQRRLLKRDQVEIGGIGAKIVDRPSGKTAKAEIDHVAASYSNAGDRMRAGSEISAKALSRCDGK